MTPERRFIQVVMSYSKYDAIGNNVRIIDAMLREKGCISYISAPDGDACDKKTLPLRSLHKFIDPKRDILIYHMAIGSDNNYVVARLKAFRKIMIFHNITPSSYLCFDDDASAALCRQGEEQLREMSGDFGLAVAVSEFNASALRACGYKNVVTVPLLVDLSFYESVQSDAAALNRYNDGKTNILFVGRGAPHKCQHDIVTAYDYFSEYCPDSRLMLVGGWNSIYRGRVERIIDDMGLRERVQILGPVSDSELKAVYSSAHMFLCMSEHEGFCVPLLESMYFGVPIMAFAAAAVPETLGGGGVLFFEKNYKAIGAMMAALVRDDVFGEMVIEAQRARLRDFDIDKIKQALLEILAPNAGEDVQAK
ncbi:glycosyl transferase [Synergistales bacterium]|nr:glycosyl transferase [Synergistales bacterium]